MALKAFLSFQLEKLGLDDFESLNTPRACQKELFGVFLSMFFGRAILFLVEREV